MTVALVLSIVVHLALFAAVLVVRQNGHNLWLTADVDAIVSVTLRVGAASRDAVSTSPVEADSLESAVPVEQRDGGSNRIAREVNQSASPAVDTVSPTVISAERAVSPAATARETSPADQQEQRSPPVSIPSSAVLQQVIGEVTEQGRAEFQPQDCTAAQRRSRLINCRDVSPSTADVADASSPVSLVSLTSTRVNPFIRRPETRTRPLTGLDVEQLRSQLDSAGLDDVTGGFAVEEIFQTMEVYSGSGNRRLDRLREQIYRNDPAYQQAQRILNPR